MQSSGTPKRSLVPNLEASVESHHHQTKVKISKSNGIAQKIFFNWRSKKTIWLNYNQIVTPQSRGVNLLDWAPYTWKQLFSLNKPLSNQKGTKRRKKTKRNRGKGILENTKERSRMKKTIKFPFHRLLSYWTAFPYHNYMPRMII